jgi:DNA mismatch repair protein MutS
VTEQPEPLELVPLAPPETVAAPVRGAAKSGEASPAMKQYAAAKQQHPDALLFFRMGDFYELFFDDAVLVAKELQLTLTARDRERSIPMCGVPFHAAEPYLARLLRKGYRVALCEQMEESGPGKKLVRREITRVLTPGTAFDSTLDGAQSNLLAAVCGQKDRYGLAMLDLTTGDFRTTEFHGSDAAQQCMDELQRTPPRELLYPTHTPLFPGADASAFTGLSGEVLARTAVEDWAWSPDYAVPLLLRTLGGVSLDGFGLAEKPEAAAAAGAILHYVKSTQPGSCEHVRSLRAYERSASLQLDAVTVRNLELIDPVFSGSGANTTLFHTLDACLTAMGKRMLKATILQPLLEAKAIEGRLDAVAALHTSLLLREEIRHVLTAVLDQERLLARIALESAGPRDLLALAQSLANMPILRERLGAVDTPVWQDIHERIAPHTELCGRVLTALMENPPALWNDGGFIAAGVDAELDELRSLSQSGRQYIAAMEERERKRTGIGSLKVRFNNVFGYYIEITKSNLHSTPPDYERKQTLVNAERFTTPELKEYETKVLTAQEQCVAIEKRLFTELRQAVLAEADSIRRTSQAVAEADMLACFAHQAALRNYVRPQLEDSSVLEAVAARHPVLEQLVATQGARYVPNDLFVDAESSGILLITGPNMGGKSTYLRQAALLVVMAQMGSFVPATQVRWGIVDRVYTRIGASDDTGRGRSTFMVEMTETANILNTATARSLILLDEMGRGTATFDGLSLAWATLEYLHAKVGARALFATHYHELTLLAEQLPGLRNLHVTCKETPSGIVFLHTIHPGPASKSYGIEVARLAGLPPQVVERARAVLRQHENSEKRNVALETMDSADAAPAAMQMTMFTPLSQRIVDRLQDTEINSLTPIQALNLLEELQRELRAGEARP